MEPWLYAAVGLLALLVIILLLRLVNLHRSVDRVSQELAQKATEDTNAPICVAIHLEFQFAIKGINIC